MFIRVLTILLCLSWLPLRSADAQEAVEQYESYFAEIVRIIDGDTIEVRVDLWPNLQGNFSVRIRGIDAPEIHRPNCNRERELGVVARAQAERLYDPGSFVKIENVQEDAFAGRVVADVKRWRSDRWLSFADEMLDREMVVKWHPNDPRRDWCQQ